MTQFYQMTTRVVNQIYQFASHTTKRVWNELKKDKFKKIVAIHACGLAAILILAAAFLVVAALVIPFFASSASLLYLGMISITYPLALFLAVVVGCITIKQANHFFASRFIQLSTSTGE